MIDRKKVVVIGAGISGLCVAWRLAKNGFDVEVYEKEPHVGGLAATVKKDGYLMDFGPHPFYSGDIEILNIFKELIGNDILTFKRDCLLSFKDSYIHYPPRPSDVLFNMGFKTAIYSALSYAKSRFSGFLKLHNERTFEEWAIRSFGKYLYKIFFGPYTEKFWKVSPGKLGDDWAAARVAKLNLLKTIVLMFFKGKAYEEFNQIERDTLPLYYPAYGCGMLPERIADELKKCGGRIYLDSTVTQIDLTHPNQYCVKVNSEKNEKKAVFDLLISSMPLKDLVNAMTPCPEKTVMESANSLKNMGLIVLFFAVKKNSILPVSYVYCFDRIFHRITEYNKFSEKLSPDGENLLSVEISCYEGDRYWNTSEEELSELCIKDLMRDGYIEREQIKQSYIFKQNSAYPVYLVGYHESLQKVKTYFHQFKDFLYLLGRNGSFNYMDQDQAMRVGIDLADEITASVSACNVSK